MLNYLSAEWYKLRHTKGIFLAFGFLLFLISLFFIPAMWLHRPTFEVYANAYIVTLMLGFFLAPIFAVRAFDDQYGRGTMKNEVVFGIPRSRIYLGKLAFGGLVGTGAALLVLAFYLGLCALIGGFGEENALLCIELCVRVTLLVLPLWLASLSLAFLFQAVMRSTAMAVVVNYLLLIFLIPIALMGSDEPTASPILNFIYRWFFVSPFRKLYVVPSITGLGDSWLVGVGWVAATTLLGLAIFSRKEIN